MKKEKYMLLNKALNDDYCIFSLIGSHAGETKDAILERKSRDILTTGNTFWVAKFGKDKIERNYSPQKIYKNRRYPLFNEIQM